MPVGEIAGRARQEAARLIERIGADRQVDPKALLRRHAPALESRADAIGVVRDDAPKRFFAGASDARHAGEVLPEHSRAVIARADQLLEGRFDLLGYRTLWFGDPIDWHVDAVSRRRSPWLHWTQIDALDPSSVGDSKVVWELNRHQWVAQLAQAFAVTGDERYAARAIASLEDWTAANPYGMGINWSSSLEAAYRVMSWTWTLMLLRQSNALEDARLDAVFASVWQHANYVSRYLSHYFSPNTHLTGEALGLFFAGAVFPQFADAARWRRTGARILVEESRRQICSDGVHFERSTCYHRYTLETYQQFVVLADRNGIDVGRDVRDRLQAMAEFTQAIARPDGMLPEIGDADGGRLLPLVTRDQCDPRGVLAVAAAMSGGLASDGEVEPEVFWLLGAEKVSDRLFAKKASDPTSSRVFPAGGFAVLRGNTEDGGHQLIVDVGPLGCPHSAGHGHADLLALDCSAFGEPVLVDPGTYCYTPEPEWRRYFRGTRAHSTLTIDGRDQIEPDGPFSWHGRAAATVHDWRTDHHTDFVDASHASYPGVVHRRRVLFVKPHYWVVVDDVEANGRDVHDLSLAFQFAPMPVDLVNHRWGKGRTALGNTFWIGAFASTPVRPRIAAGETAPIRGWVSRGYGQREPAPQLVYEAKASGRWRCITLLMPQRGACTAPAPVSLLQDDHNLPIGLELEQRRESIFVDETDLFVSAHH